LDIAIAYEKTLEKVRSAILELERKQIQLGVGMTVAGPAFEGPDAEKWLREMTSPKHGADWISDAIRTK